MKEFAFWLSVGRRGLLDRFVTIGTLCSYIHTFLGLWPRYAHRRFPYEHVAQVKQFLLSPEFIALVPLTTHARKKNVFGVSVLDLLVRVALEDVSHFRTPHMIPQVVFVAELIVYTAERIGTIIESERHHDSNQGIEWRDTTWWIVPNTRDPAHPYVLVYLHLRLLKNSRTNQSKTKSIILVVDHPEKRATCPLASLLTLALYDRIFAHVSSAEETFNPVHPPSQAHILSIQPHMQHVPILREEVFDPATATTTISPDRTLKYMTFAKHLRWAGLQAGLPDPVKAMDARNTATNLFGQELSDDDRTVLQAHSPQSSTYFVSAEIKVLQADTAASQAKRVCIARLQAEASQLARDHHNLFERERRIALGEARADHFDGASERILRGVASADSAPKPMAAVASVSVPVADAPRSLTDLVRTLEADDTPKPPVVRASQALVRLAYEEDLVPITFYELHIAVINALLTLPRRHNATCYPGEYIDEDGKCPVCGIDCTALGSPGPGLHIHRCLRARLVQDTQSALDEAYEPATCDWNSCKSFGCAFETRQALSEHIAIHIQFLTKNPVRCCRWTVDQDDTCDAQRSGWWSEHFAAEHGVMTDEKGDRSAWTNHCKEHYHDLFEPFEVRAGGIDVRAIGIVLSESDNLLRFTPGSGFDGKLPEFHGHIIHQVALVPAFCIWFHAYDDSVAHLKTHLEGLDPAPAPCPVPSCGTRIFSHFDLLTHIVCVHRLPVCGSTTATLTRTLQLPVRLPEVPTPSASNPAPLLPPFIDLEDSDDALPTAVRRAASVIELDSDGEMVPAAQPTPPPQRQRVDPDYLQPQKRQMPDITTRQGYCNGCYRHLQDIDTHLATSRPESACSTSQGSHQHRCPHCRRTFHDIRDHLPNDKCDTEFFYDAEGVRHWFKEWLLTAPPRTNVLAVNHKCLDCKKAFLDILEHANRIRRESTRCPATRFVSKKADGSWSDPTLVADYKQSGV
ncbi:hypothetical protein OF83DRAFT_1183561 [Amylostereum chailletii]|nr:hypothetical protein OF83DRAFT_1183561 [Amylostereum chailletii]